MEIRVSGGGVVAPDDLGTAARNIRLAESVLRSSDVHEPQRSNYHRDISAQHLQQRANHEQRPCGQRANTAPSQATSTLSDGSIARSEVCRQVTLPADPRYDGYYVDFCCIGASVCRSRCLRCAWFRRGQQRSQEAHECRWRWGRDPVVERPPVLGTSIRRTTAIQWWMGAVNGVYAEGWLEVGEPILTAPVYVDGTLEVSSDTGFRSYDLCGETHSEPVR